MAADGRGYILWTGNTADSYGMVKVTWPSPDSGKPVVKQQTVLYMAYMVQVGGEIACSDALGQLLDRHWRGPISVRTASL